MGDNTEILKEVTSAFELYQNYAHDIDILLEAEKTYNLFLNNRSRWYTMRKEVSSFLKHNREYKEVYDKSMIMFNNIDIDEILKKLETTEQYCQLNALAWVIENHLFFTAYSHTRDYSGKSAVSIIDEPYQIVKKYTQEIS